jgi:hypothetical protein
MTTHRQAGWSTLHDRRHGPRPGDPEITPELVAQHG